MLTEFDSSREVLDQVNNLELNAYLSEAQVQEFQHLESEQKTISAATAGLLELESQMKPEDTKVGWVKNNIYCLKYFQSRLINSNISWLFTGHVLSFFNV